MDAKRFEKEMIERLRNSNIIDHVMMGDVLDDMTNETLLELLRKPLQIELNDEGLNFVDENGDKVQCPNYGINIQSDGKWLSDKIPTVSFDIDQNGNIRRAEEAEAAYCCIITTLVIDNDVFRDELEEVIKNYNYEELDGVVKGENFKKLLTGWLDLQSTTVNVCVCAAKYTLSNTKKDTEKFLRDGISDEARGELRNLCDNIKDINRKYSTGTLSPAEVKKLNKIEILQELQSKKTEIDQKVDQASCGTIYRILTLSSEYVSPITKKRLLNKANESIVELLEEDKQIELLIGERRVLLERWKKRYIKFAKIDVRKREMNKYLENPSAYKLPAKL